MIEQNVHQSFVSFCLCVPFSLVQLTLLCTSYQTTYLFAMCAWHTMEIEEDSQGGKAVYLLPQISSSIAEKDKNVAYAMLTVWKELVKRSCMPWIALQKSKVAGVYK